MRIIDKVIQMALDKVTGTILCGVNIAFQSGQRMEQDTLSMAKVARYVHTHGGGCILALDADKAYDRVRITFLARILRAIR